MIGGDPEWFFKRNWPGASEPPAFFDPEAVADYWRAFSDPQTVHAICEDYRAGATYDLQARRGGFRQAQDRLPAAGALGREGRGAEDSTIRSRSGADWADNVSGQAIEAATIWPRSGRRRR